MAASIRAGGGRSLGRGCTVTGQPPTDVESIEKAHLVVENEPDHADDPSCRREQPGEDSGGAEIEGGDRPIEGEGGNFASPPHLEFAGPPPGKVEGAQPPQDLTHDQRPADDSGYNPLQQTAQQR